VRCPLQGRRRRDDASHYRKSGLPSGSSSPTGGRARLIGYRGSATVTGSGTGITLDLPDHPVLRINQTPTTATTSPGTTPHGGIAASNLIRPRSATATTTEKCVELFDLIPEATADAEHSRLAANHSALAGLRCESS
jgi:hypothetical protein